MYKYYIQYIHSVNPEQMRFQVLDLVKGWSVGKIPPVVISQGVKIMEGKIDT